MDIALWVEQNIMMGGVWRRQKGESLTLTRLINGLGRCPSIDVNARSRYCMQRMHQSYKCMKAQQKKLSGCASNLLAHEDLGHLRKPIVGIYKLSSIMKNSHQYMKVTKQETLYHKDHGATLKHKCGKRIVALSPFFIGPFFLFGLSLFFIWDNAL